jgi:WD40 repeat protein
VLAAGDWIVVSDTQNRVLVYSLKTGESKGRVFGGFGTVALSTGLLCVENEIGKIAFYNLNTLEKVDEMVFSSAIAMLQFSPDGHRLFVLTSDQTVYVLDASSLTSKKA